MSTDFIDAVAAITSAADPITRISALEAAMKQAPSMVYPSGATAADFVQPESGKTVTITVDRTAWMNTAQPVLIGKDPGTGFVGGYYVPTSIASATTVTLKLLAYFGPSSAPNSTVPSGSPITIGSPGGAVHGTVDTPDTFTWVKREASPAVYDPTALNKTVTAKFYRDNNLIGTRTLVIEFDPVSETVRVKPGQTSEVDGITWETQGDGTDYLHVSFVHTVSEARIRMTVLFFDVSTTTVQGTTGKAGAIPAFSFKRNAGAPATPTGGSYASPQPTTAGWQEAPPVGSDPVWMSKRIFTEDGLSPQEANWSAPIQVTQEAQVGVGVDGEYTSFVFQRSAAQPATPAGATDPPVGWSDGDPYPASTDPLWMTWARFNGDGTLSLTWGDPIKVTAQQGGYKSFVFIRSATLPAVPTGGSWSSPVPAGWSDTPPPGSDPVWLSVRFFTFDGLTPQDASWSDPARVTGEDGTGIGPAGKYNSFVFQRAPAKPSTPTGATNPPVGWDDGDPNPASSDPLWMTWARFNGDDTLDLTWIEPVKVSGEDGADGADGADGTDGVAGPFIYFQGAFDLAETYHGTAERRDIVEDGGNYYIVVANKGTFAGVTTATGTHWEIFTNFNLVATDILLAGDVVIHRKMTLSTLSGSKGIINSSGATAFGTGNGIWIDTDGNARFGDPAGKHLKYDAGTGILTVEQAVIDQATITGANITGALKIEGVLQASQIKRDDVRIFNSAAPANVMRPTTRVHDTNSGVNTGIDTDEPTSDDWVLGGVNPIAKFYPHDSVDAAADEDNRFATSDPVFTIHAKAKVRRYLSIWWRQDIPGSSWVVAATGYHNSSNIILVVASGMLSLTAAINPIEFGISSRRGDGVFPSTGAPENRRVDDAELTVISHNW